MFGVNSESLLAALEGFEHTIVKSLRNNYNLSVKLKKYAETGKNKKCNVRLKLQSAIRLHFPSPIPQIAGVMFHYESQNVALTIVPTPSVRRFVLSSVYWR